jgi:hypothetical protein
VKLKVNTKLKKEADPLDFLADEYEIVEQTVDKVSVADDSPGFQDTIIGSHQMSKFSIKGSKTEVNPKDKENKVPALKLKPSGSKYNNPNVLNISQSNEVDIDMLLSEEGEIHEESIIQISENSINKHAPVKIRRDKLVKVDPVERLQEVLKNSQRGNPEEGSGEKRNKQKPMDYEVKPDHEEESVKLDDLIGPRKLSGLNKKIRIPQNTGIKAKPQGYKNIFFDVNSAKNDTEVDSVMSLLESESYDEQSIQSQRNQFTPANNNSKPIFFGMKPKLSKRVNSTTDEEDVREFRKSKPVDKDEDNIESLICEELEYFQAN